MPKQQTNFITLNQNSDFRRVYYRGKSYTHPALVTYVLPSRAGICRIGITTSKKIGNAVQRNRARRIIRAAFYNILRQETMIKQCDIVFVARTKTTFLKTSDIEPVMRSHLASAGVLK